MSEIKHTPTPWEFDGDRDEMHIHVQGGIIASIFTPDDSPCFAPENPEEGEHVWLECIANGRIIVEAVNNHERLTQRVQEIEALLNTPEVEDFDKAVPLEAAHQQLRWGASHDAGKNPEDWFWLIGYLAGKGLAAFKAGDDAKAKHHCISAAAALRNWHAHIRSGASQMRPGISAGKSEVGQSATKEQP